MKFYFLDYTKERRKIVVRVARILHSVPQQYPSQCHFITLMQGRHFPCLLNLDGLTTCFDQWYKAEETLC